MYIFQSKTSGPSDAHTEEAVDKRVEHEVYPPGLGQTRAGGRVRSPRPPDHVPRPAGARRVHSPEPDQAPTGGVHQGVGEAVHAGGDVQSPGHD